jgi:hypothetical protein
MIHLRLEVKLTLLGPILTQATGAGRLGIDAVIARDRQERPYLPYSLVRGKLRQALEELQDALADPNEAKTVQDDIERWFGVRTGSNDTNNQRGTFFFEDFVHPKPMPLDDTLTRIQMDSKTHAAAERMLLVIDAPFGYGKPAEFIGVIRGLCATVDEAKRAQERLGAGLNWMTQLGAERTVGFGRVKEVEVSRKEADSQSKSSLQPTESPAPTHYAIRLRPRAPFCFGGKPMRANVFESETIIPGNALLGALASIYCTAAPRKLTEVQTVAGMRWQTLARYFARLRFTHAFPARRGTNIRPTVWPLSLVAAEPGPADIPEILYDVALCSRPRMIQVGDTERPPVFSSDWKRHRVTKKAETLFGWPDDIRKELRVRTAIDPAKLKAEEEKLFAYEMVDPDGLDWLATLDLSRVDEADRGPLLADLDDLLSGVLGPLGKTKTDADIWIEPMDSLQAAVASTATPIAGNRWVITLQTPAILCEPDDMHWSASELTGNKLLAGYGQVFAELSGNILKVERFFAKQSLVNSRFAGQLPKHSGRYYPFLLTDAGSTFVLSVDQGDVSTAQAIIHDWLSYGIPLAASLAQRFGSKSDADWKRCPILDRHGFGEIIVNPPWLCRSAQSDEPIPVEGQ